MMNSYGIFRITKLKTMGNLKGSLLHARREQPTFNADPTLTPNNQLLTNTPTVEAVLAKYEQLQPKKIRADQVRAIEVLVTASPEALAKMTAEQKADFFKKSLEFANKEMGGAGNLLHAEIHNDETSPHLTAFYIPIVESRNARSGKVKKGLNAKKILGDQKAFSERQTRFFEQVSQHFGLERGEINSKAEHKKVKDWYRELNKNEALVDMSLNVKQPLENAAKTAKDLILEHSEKPLLASITKQDSKIEQDIALKIVDKFQYDVQNNLNKTRQAMEVKFWGMSYHKKLTLMYKNQSKKEIEKAKNELKAKAEAEIEQKTKKIREEEQQKLTQERQKYRNLEQQYEQKESFLERCRSKISNFLKVSFGLNLSDAIDKLFEKINQQANEIAQKIKEINKLRSDLKVEQVKNANLQNSYNILQKDVNDKAFLMKKLQEVEQAEKMSNSYGFSAPSPTRKGFRP